MCIVSGFFALGVSFFIVEDLKRLKETREIDAKQKGEE